MSRDRMTAINAGVEIACAVSIPAILVAALAMSSLRPLGALLPVAMVGLLAAANSLGDDS